MHPFDRDITLQQKGPLSFRGEVSKNWLINDIANGGYVLALAAKAMQTVSDKHGTPIITANYIGPCIPGEIDIELEKIAQSYKFTRFQARLFQDGKEKTRVWGTFMKENIGTAVERYEKDPPKVAPREECVLMPANSGNTLSQNLEMFLDPDSAKWMKGELNHRSDMRGWVRFREERGYDLPAVLLMADSMPPPIFITYGVFSWVPTIELSVSVRKRPLTSWLKFRLHSCYLTNGIIEEDGEVWDEDGNLACICRQIAQVRLSE